MIDRRNLILGASIAGLVPALPRVSKAETVVGITDSEIRFGNTMAYSGPASSFGVLGTTFAAYFRSVNDLGGVNGRKLKFISYDDGFSPPKTLEMARRLVEEDGVAFLALNLGTACNSAIYRYLNRSKVPHLFVSAPASKFSDPKNSPWTIGFAPSYFAEATLYAQYILKTKPDARIAILYQNDDFGKDFLRGLENGLGERAKAMIVSQQSYLATDPSIGTQLIAAKASGANVFVNACLAKFASLAFRGIGELDWHPLHILNATSQSIDTVLKPVGLDKAVGIVTSAYMKDPSDPQWKEDSGVGSYNLWAQKYIPSLRASEYPIVYAYSAAQTLVEVLRQCGNDLSRENIMRQALSIHNLKLPLLLPNITVDTNEKDYRTISALAIQQFDGSRWVMSGDLIRTQ